MPKSDAAADEQRSWKVASRVGWNPVRAMARAEAPDGSAWVVYRSSNDASFNPNVGAGGGSTWQRMEPGR